MTWVQGDHRSSSSYLGSKQLLCYYLILPNEEREREREGRRRERRKGGEEGKRGESFYSNLERESQVKSTFLRRVT